MRISSYLLLVVVSKLLFGSDLNFYREDLNFFLKDSLFTVDGNYYFKPVGSQSVKSVLYYPFPYGKDKGSIKSSMVYDLNANKIVEISGLSPKGFFFPVEAESNSTGRYKIGYSQVFHGKSADYILTSTNTWGRPLAEVSYTLTTDSNLVIEYFSFPPDKTSRIADKKVYSWQKTNFLPDKDFIIRWK